MALSPLEAIRKASSVELPSHLSHAFVILATFWPHIYPTQELLAKRMHVKRRGLNKRLHQLEEMGYITRYQRTDTSTFYVLHFRPVNRDEDVSCGTHKEQVEALDDWASDL